MTESTRAFAGPIAADAFEPDLNNRSINVGIIGAGIAGLGAAVALRRSGHKVQIFERSRFKDEVGAAINSCPNATRILNYYGFDFRRSKGVITKRSEFMKGDTLETIMANDIKGFPEKFGADYYFLHRVDLHTELRRLAEEPNGQTEPVQISLSSDIIDVDVDTAELTLKDGSKYKKDLIVAADGIHSFLTGKVIGSDTPARPTGQSAFRFLISTEKLMQDPEAHQQIASRPDGIYVANAPDRRLVWYPCRAGEIFNFVGIHPDDQTATDSEDFTADARLEDLLNVYKSFNPGLRAMCRNADEIKLWKLLYRPPISRWVKGRLVLIGDAAHPMLPHQGQGGAQAIEDGAALGALLSKLGSVEEIPARLHLFQELRKNRAAAMQIFSNAGQDRAGEIQDEAQKYVDGPVPKNPHEFHEWNFSYDVLRHSLNVLSSEVKT
ncbi:putative salicylate hydroxylase [Viridothelium virens]|uniref:Putative salicylate hydroxylase n=1 Tax=Viridothelium virens TaxID=1048519 RepID=A0A6A6HAA0_VIRVR|nr:putative salicylate hydroxylase [Viridothelium virens]